MNALPCKHLRTKLLYLPGPAFDAARPADRDAACQCWCTKTMTEVGRDDRHVDPAACADARRPCYAAD